MKFDLSRSNRGARKFFPFGITSTAALAAVLTFGGLAIAGEPNGPDDCCGKYLFPDAVTPVVDGKFSVPTVPFRQRGGMTAAAPPSPVSFTNATAIGITDCPSPCPASGQSATLYPSPITVSGVSGPVEHVTITLNGFSHSFPADVDFLLVSPSGRKSVLMSDFGAGSPGVSGINVTLNDYAERAVPSTVTGNTGFPFASGTYRPANSGTTDLFPSPAPAAPYTYTLSAFNGDSPNGTWNLYVIDDANLDGGNISGGWTITFAARPAAPAAGSILVSEFRTRGAGTSPPSSDGSADEFIELYNNTDSSITIIDAIPGADPTSPTGAGWRFAGAQGATETTFLVLPQTLSTTGPMAIPARGHFLITTQPTTPSPAGNTYSLSAYPTSTGITSSGATNISINPASASVGFMPDDLGLAVFSTAAAVSARRLDSVGVSSVTNPDYKEGTGLSPANGITTAGQHSWVRKIVDGVVQDTGDNAADFQLVSTTGEMIDGVASTLGAPGPQRAPTMTAQTTTSAPIHAVGANNIVVDVIDPAQAFGAAPNALYDATPVTNGPLGTVKLRVKVTNNSGLPFLSLRYRIVDLSTFTGGVSPVGKADLRVLSSTLQTVTLTDTTTTTVQALTLQTPAAQPSGGGVNSSLSEAIITTTAPLGNGASTNVEFLFGVQQFGSIQLGIITEILNTGLYGVGETEPLTATGTINGGGLTLTRGTPVAPPGPVVFTGAPVTSQGGNYQAGGNNLPTREMNFLPTPNTGYTYVEVTGAANDIIGTFNDLPQGGVVAMNLEGTIYYFQANYDGGTDGNDLVLTNFNPAPAEWKWIAGPSSRNGVGIYGNIGVAAPTNNPGARQGAMNWLAPDGSLWMFGGYGYATNVTNPPRYLNDVWQYRRDLGQWVWRAGNNTPNNFGAYGTMGVEASENTPGSRHTGTTWTDGDGNLWLFGGFGVGTGVGAASLNDLWRFNRTNGQWTWVKGSTVTGAAAVYGTQGTGAAANTPGARSSAAGVYANGFLWLFGGYTGNDYYNDLWRYEIATNQWAWISGSSTPNQNGVYGTQGTAAPGNAPGSRRDATAWAGKDGKLWFFGGLGLPASGTTAGDLSDLWNFDPVSGNWTWVKGVNTTGADGVYGTKNIPDSANLPGARSAGSGWATIDGDLWLIGGFKNSFLTFNDVWIYDVGSNQWTWKQGAAGTLSESGVYGIKGEAAPTNQPGGRFTPSTWVTINGSLWIFGGGGADAFGNTGRLSDLWSYGIQNPPGAPYDNFTPSDFPDSLIVNDAPSADNETASTMAYVPVSGRVTGTDPDGDRLLFNAVGSTTISQGKLALNLDGTWTFTPAAGFTGVAGFRFTAADNYGGQSSVKTLVITVSTNPADTDNDGIADSYEQSVWGGLAAADGEGDADFDGQSNYFEFLAGTNPLDSSEAFSTTPGVAGTSTASGGVLLQLNHVRPGVNYHLELSPDLNTWSRVGTFTFDVSGSATVEDPSPSTSAPKFYRIKLEATSAAVVP